MVHDGDKYFEHCYGADFDPRVAQDQKELCWQAWIAHYTKHQPSHRIDYALSRVEALQNGEPPPALPGLVRGALTPAEVRSELDAAAAAASNTSAALLSPTSADGGNVPNGCMHFCDQYDARCRARCTGLGPKCPDTCERERAVCLNGCY